MELRQSRWKIWLLFLLVILITAIVVIPRAEGEVQGVSGAARASVLNTIGTGSVAGGQHETATDLYPAAVRSDPGIARGWINPGIMQEQRGRLDDGTRTSVTREPTVSPQETVTMRSTK